MAILSPWPPSTSVVARAAAIARLRRVVAGRTNIEPTIPARIAEVEAIDVADRTPEQAARLAADKAALAAADETTNSLGEMASALVERQAPGAPQAIRDEAVIRFAGYVSQSDFGGIAKESVGPMDTEYVTNHAAMFRNCGAAALLSRWRVRRAGAIG